MAEQNCKNNKNLIQFPFQLSELLPITHFGKKMSSPQIQIVTTPPKVENFSIETVTPEDTDEVLELLKTFFFKVRKKSHKKSEQKINLNSIIAGWTIEHIFRFGWMQRVGGIFNQMYFR